MLYLNNKKKQIIRTENTEMENRQIIKNWINQNPEFWTLNDWQISSQVYQETQRKKIVNIMNNKQELITDPMDIKNITQVYS